MWKPQAIIIATMISTLILFAITAFAESPNYCHDKESWKQWNDLVAKRYDDDGVQALHALRLGLCTKIEQGSITLDRAVTIFEKARVKLVEKWQDEALRPPEEGTTN